MAEFWRSIGSFYETYHVLLNIVLVLRAAVLAN